MIKTPKYRLDLEREVIRFEGFIKSCNAAIRAVFGYLPTDEELDRILAWDFVFHDQFTKPESRHEVQAALDTKRTYLSHIVRMKKAYYKNQ